MRTTVVTCGMCGNVNGPGKFYCTQCGNNLGLAASAPNPSVNVTAVSGATMGTTALVGFFSIIALLGIIALVGVFALFGVAGLNNLTGLVWKSGPRIMFSREALSNGRTDTVRPSSTSNPMGLRGVAGFGNPDTGIPGLLTSIAAAPDPMRITLDENGDGRVDIVGNPVARDCTGLLSCFSLLVADEFPPDGTRWENIGLRDSAGSLYATVNVPSANIFAGQELITDQELRAYTANSIIYEAPDYGVSPASVIDTKGTIRVRAAPRPQPDTPRLQDLLEAPEINYARDVKVEIEVLSACEHYGDIALNLRAKLTGFDPLFDCHFRWAYDGNGVKFVKDVVADEHVTFFLPADQKGQLVNLWVAVSSKGLGVGNPNPFVQQPPLQEVGNMTFVTTGSAVAAKRPYTVKIQSAGEYTVDNTIANDDGQGKIKLKGLYIKRILPERTSDGFEKIEESTMPLPLRPVTYTGSYSDQHFEYDVTSVLTIQAPSVIPVDERFDVFATLDVTWNVRRCTPGMFRDPLLATLSIQDYDKGRVANDAKPDGQGDLRPGVYKATAKVSGKQMRGSIIGGDNNETQIWGAACFSTHKEDSAIVFLDYDLMGWLFRE